MMTPLMIAPLVAGLIWKLMMSSNFGIVNEFLTRIGILSSPSEILWLCRFPMVIDRLLYCRYMADYTVYDADDSGWPSGIGYQRVRSSKNGWSK